MIKILSIIVIEAKVNKIYILISILDLAYNTIVKIESGENKNPTIETLRKIAKALEINVDDLIK